MIWRSLQYDWGSAVGLVLIVIFIAWTFNKLYQFREKQLNYFADNRLLNIITVKREPAVFWTKVTLCCLVWLLAIFALMQPKGNERYAAIDSSEQVISSGKKLVRKKTHQVILLIDTSASMGVSDLSGGTTRLAFAKEIADQVVSRLKGENISLLSFTASTTDIVPSTTNYFFTRLMINQLTINEGDTPGTDFQQAFNTIAKQYIANSSNQISKTLILMTDGGDTHLEELKENNSSQTAYNAAVQTLLKPLTNPETHQMQIVIVGIGSTKGGFIPGVTLDEKPVTSSLNTSLLQQISDALHSRLLIADQMTFLEISQAIMNTINQQSEHTNQIQATEDNSDEHLYDYYFQFPLALALIALALFLLIPNTLLHKNHRTSDDNEKT